MVEDRCETRAQRQPDQAVRHSLGQSRPRRKGGGLRSVARPVQPDPGMHGTPRPRDRQRAVRDYVSSLPVDAKVLMALVRGHWGVENGLHRTSHLDMHNCRLHTGHGPAVMGIQHLAALNNVRAVQ